MSVFLSNFEYFIEKDVCLLARVWVSIFDMPKLLPKVQNLSAKTTKMCYHVGTLEAFHLSTLDIIEKAKRPNFHSLPIKLLNFLHLLSDRHSVNCPLEYNAHCMLKVLHPWAPLIHGCQPTFCQK